jgi:predicted metal-dependent phosphotriesterase family hydrolase
LGFEVEQAFLPFKRPFALSCDQIRNGLPNWSGRQWTVDADCDEADRSLMHIQKVSGRTVTNVVVCATGGQVESLGEVYPLSWFRPKKSRQAQPEVSEFETGLDERVVASEGRHFEG